MMMLTAFLALASASPEASILGELHSTGVLYTVEQISPAHSQAIMNIEGTTIRYAHTTP